MSSSSPRGRHRAPVRARGWAPRALLSAATAPIGVALGIGAAVLAAVIERPGLAVVGVVLAGGPALFHAARATVLDRELRGRHEAGRTADDGEAPAGNGRAPVIDLRTDRGSAATVPTPP